MPLHFHSPAGPQKLKIYYLGVRIELIDLPNYSHTGCKNYSVTSNIISLQACVNFFHIIPLTLSGSGMHIIWEPFVTSGAELDLPLMKMKM